MRAVRVSNRRRLPKPKQSTARRRVCAGCQRGEHPRVPHCAYCAVELPRSGEHPEPVCPDAQLLQFGQALS